MVAERQRVVVDASLAVNFAIPGQPYHAQAAGLFRHRAAGQVALVAPPLFESEADSVIRRYVYQGLLDQEAGRAAQELLVALPIATVQDPRVRRRAREIAERLNQSRVYDATYAALAEFIDCEFWTADRMFHRAARGVLDGVRFVEEVDA